MYGILLLRDVTRYLLTTLGEKKSTANAIIPTFSHKKQHLSCVFINSLIHLTNIYGFHCLNNAQPLNNVTEN